CLAGGRAARPDQRRRRGPSAEGRGQRRRAAGRGRAFDRRGGRVLMMATWRALAAWPYEPRPASSSSFRTTWNGSLAKLEEEISRIQGDDVVIGIVADPSQISFSGVLGAGAKVNYPGAEVSFELPG